MKRFLKTMEMVTRFILGDKPTPVKPKRKKRKYRRRVKK